MLKLKVSAPPKPSTQLTLILHNFMGHPDYELTLNKGEVTLISGDSESGKTSILCAIAWCLHGKLQKVQRGKTDMVYVELRMPGITIYRQARPGRLVVTKAGKKILSDAAQKIIDDEYHSKGIWQTCSLINQKKQCFLLEASYSERLKILSALAFDEDDPKKYKAKIEEFQETVKVEYANKMKDYEVAKRIFEETFKKDIYPPCSEDELVLKQAIITTTECEVGNLAERLSQLEAELKKEEHKTEQLNILNKQLSELQEKKSGLNIASGDPEVLFKEINKIQKHIDEYDELQTRYRSYLKVKMRLDALPVVDDIPREMCTEKSYYAIKTQEDNYKASKKITDDIRLTYDVEAIENCIIQHKTLIKRHNQYYPLLSILKELETLENQGLSVPNTVITTEQILQEKTKYSEMKKASEVLKCPHCDKSVQYSDGKLIGLHINHITAAELKVQYDIVKELYNNYKAQNDIQTVLSKIKDLQSKIPDRLALSEYKPIDVSVSYRIINRLEQVKIIECPLYDSHNIRIATSRLKLSAIIEREYSDFGPDFGEVSMDIQTLRKKLNETKLSHNNITAQQKELEKLESMIALIREKVVNITPNPNIRLECDKIGDTLIDTRDALSKSTEFCIENDSLLKLKSIKTELDMLLKKLNALHSLIKKAVNLSCKMLDDTVDSISAHTKPILSKIFGKSVALELKLFKEMRGKKVNGVRASKQMVNLDVYFDAKKHEKRMCGGEIDRISIALLLALNRCSHSPFILLDELLGTVSSEVAGKCIKQIKRYAQNKFVVCIEHNAIAGRYDRVIKL